MAKKSYQNLVGPAMAEAEQVAAGAGGLAAPVGDDVAPDQNPFESEQDGGDLEDQSLGGDVAEGDDQTPTIGQATKPAAPTPGQPPAQDATQQAAQPGQPPAQDATFPFALKRGNREFKDLTYKQVVAYAQMGLNHEVKGRELNEQLQGFQSERQRFQQEQAQVQQEMKPLKDFDQWMKSDPRLAAAIEQTVIQYHQQQQAQGGQPQQYQQGAQQAPQQQYQQAQAQPAANDPRIEEMYSYIKEMQDRAADQHLDQLMDGLKRDHADVPWDLPDADDPKGRTPETKIYDYMVENRVNDPKAAMWALYGPHLIAKKEQAAKVAAAQNIQRKHRQGAVLANRPTQAAAPPAPSLDGFRGQKYGATAAKLRQLIESGEITV